MGSVPGLTQCVKGSGVAMSYGVGRRHNSDPALLWLRYRPAATAPIRSLAWELPYTMGWAIKRQKKKKKKKKKEELEREYTIRKHIRFFFI